MISNTKTYKIAVSCFELILGIPLIGGTIILANRWTPLMILLGVHILGLVISLKTNKSINGHIVGILGNMIGVIPFVGMFMHLCTGILLLLEGIRDK